ncbi:MAG: L-aspartate oxidase [Candidatus Omnitrophica bacterium]|nr:L-aspartate oxidase [Candidatus Omnitrophota bacterium]
MTKFYLTSFNIKKISSIQTDILIVGSGVAGLCAAIEAAKYTKVLIITKDKLQDGNTEQAQGGIAVVLSREDSFKGHAEDTLRVGSGLCNEEAVRILVDEGPSRVQELIQWGANFDKEGENFSFTQEAGHNMRRIIHAKGDATGAEVERTLILKVKGNKNIKILEHTFAIDLLHKDRICFGAVVYNEKEGKKAIYAQKTILATGGIGQIYRETTNSIVATGCGLALAFRAGAKLMDMEFVQFHPTTLYIAGAARILISETIRGEGGMLKNKYGERFMGKYHEDGELAPRDVVSRAILREMKKSNDTHVYLDITHLNSRFLENRFPGIMEVCFSLGIDIKKDLIPVRPTAHYMIGGIKTAMNGGTNVENLYACGETACSGLHGANRLASNSLLEGLVFGFSTGFSAGKSIRSGGRIKNIPEISSTMDYGNSKDLDLDKEDIKNSLKSLMSRYLGIERDGKALLEAQEKIDSWSSYVMKKEFFHPKAWELQNMLQIAKLMQKAALIRRESRGVHYRKDFPKRNDSEWQESHIELSKDKDFEIITI